MNKYLSTLLIIIAFNANLLLAKPVHEKIWVGMSIKSFNNLNLGTFVPDQKRKSALTSYGLVHLDSASMKRYFDLKDQVWKGVLVEMKNNKISQYTLQGTMSVSNIKLQDVFSDLLRIHGVSFGLNEYRSLSKKGYSVIWHQQNQLVSLNITVGKNNKCNISLKKAFTNQAPATPKLNEKAIASLEPILGKGFHTLDPFQIAGEPNTNNQLDDLLAN